MSQKVKLIQRLKSKPKDFTYQEAVSLLSALDLKESNKGKTSGSRVMFLGKGVKITMHKPHPNNELKSYQIVELIKNLEAEGLL